jgi:hypothetical protein
MDLRNLSAASLEPKVPYRLGQVVDALLEGILRPSGGDRVPVELVQREGETGGPSPAFLNAASMIDSLGGSRSCVSTFFCTDAVSVP